jgi:hypothetical protein
MSCILRLYRQDTYNLKIIIISKQINLVSLFINQFIKINEVQFMKEIL